jgi:hypothetical protein
MSALPLGAARRARGIFEGTEWSPHLHALGLTQAEWDEYFRFTIETNISVQPLVNTHPFVTEDLRLIQMSIPNRWLIWIYFRIEPDDNNCTLLWMETRQINRIG